MAAELERIIKFLAELDSELSFDKPQSLYLIGGAAITLAYDHENRTADLDFIDPPAVIAKKGGDGSALAEKHGISVSPVYEINFSAPKDWRDKSRLLELGLKNLKIYVASVEDIILGKLARMEPKDFEDIISLYNLNKINPRKLLKRLAENKKEFKEVEYRNNCKLLFREIFSLKITFERGTVRLVDA